MAAFEIYLTMIGAWLVLAPFLLKTRIGWWADVSFRLCCGMALALLAPWSHWSLAIMVPVLSMLGVCMATCHWIGTAFVSSLCCSSALGGLLWQSVLCKSVDPWWHGWIMSAVILVFTTVFTCSFAGPLLFLPVVLPLMSAALLAVGLAGLEVSEELDFQSTQLFASTPCAAVQGEEVVTFAGVWCGLTIVLMLIRMIAARCSKDKSVDADGTLVQSLIPGGEDSLMPRPQGADGENRHVVICAAIYAPEDADLSHLSENERKLVEICRNDEEERDRVMFGGGLY